MTLRPYQLRARAEVAREYRAGHRRPLVVAPTGSGKTVLGVAITEGALRKGRRVGWCAHRTELVGQAEASLLDAGVDRHAVGVIQRGQRSTCPDAPIQVCSVQTLTAQREAPPADVLVFDEAHHVACATWRAIYGTYPAIEMVLGLTATPERGDGAGLGDVFDCIVQAATTAELTEQGYLVPADVIAPAEYRDKLALPPVEAWTKYAPGALTVAFCRDVAHAQATAAEFRRAGVPAAALSGTTPWAERERILADLASGVLRVVCNVDVLTEGWDLPAIGCVLMARRTHTWGRWMQAVGRGLRPAPGKERCTILDPYGLVHRHGLPTDPRVFTLSGTSAAQALLSLRQCRACGCVFRVDCCPRCGWRAPPRPAPKVKRADMGRVEGVRVVSAAQKQKKLAELAAIAKAKGHDPRWVGIRFKAIYGHWPGRL